MISKHPLYGFITFLLGSLWGSYWASTPTLIVNCKNAPQQYKDAGSWQEGAANMRCAKEGEKGIEHPAFYQDVVLK